MNKRKVNIRLIMLVIMALMMLLVSGCERDELKRNSDGTIRVMVSTGEGVRILSQNPINIMPGESAEFLVEFDDNCILNTLSAGYITDGVLRLDNVQRRTNINLTAINLGYSTDVSYKYFFKGSSADVSSVGSSTTVRAGTLISVSANEKYRTFVGWSLNNRTTDKSKMISFDRNFTFRISPDMASGSGIVRLFANYVDNNFYYYNANGGNVNFNTGNTETNDYYTAVDAGGGRVKITLSDKYISNYESVSLFYDDSTFVREGYVLAEYNTRADGSGTSYSLGSKFFAEHEGGAEDELYCIWKPVSDGFTYETVASMPNPTSDIRAPFWKTSGVTITSYTGNADEVVIPETIDGRPVIGISSGAFVNKSVKTLVLSKSIQRIEDNAFIGCTSLNTIYYPDSIYYISNNALDRASYTSLKNMYVNATMAPRYSATSDGAFGIKLSRLLAGKNENRIIVIAGSSTYQGLASEYMEALLGDSYRVINFGTTRTTSGLIYLEGMRALSHSGDIILYAPENSTYMMGENELYWKTLRDLESMNNFYRYIDISGYSNFFSAFADFNQNYRYQRNPVRYEDSVKVIEQGRANKYGELISRSDTAYIDAYYITMNDMYKTKFEGSWSDVNMQESNKNYKDPNNITWASILNDEFRSNVNRAIRAAKSSGARVYFTFCPVDADKLFDEAKNEAWLAAYDNMMKTSFEFDGIVGESRDYVFAHEYFYDCAFHLNDVGRTLRTYRMYVDLCAMMGITPAGFRSVGESFSGCEFERGNSTGFANTIPDYLM